MAMRPWAITAIVLVAVIMGMSVISPAMAKAEDPVCTKIREALEAAGLSEELIDQILNSIPRCSADRGDPPGT